MFGDSLNPTVGSPVNEDAPYPLASDPDMMLRHVMLTQALSENFAVFLGKLDMTTGEANALAY